MEKNERHYDITKLNKLFALVSLVLLASVIFLFVNDYSREWKKYQKEFRALEVEKFRSRHKEEEALLTAKPEYKEILAKINDSKKQVAQKSGERQALERELPKLQAKMDLAQQVLVHQQTQLAE